MVHEPASSMRIHELSTLDAKSANPAGTASALLILPSSSVRCLFSLECDRGGGAGVIKITWILKIFLEIFRNFVLKKHILPCFAKMEAKSPVKGLAYGAIASMAAEVGALTLLVASY